MFKKITTVVLIIILSVSVCYADGTSTKLSKDHQRDVELYNKAIANGTLSFSNEYEVYNSNTKIGYTMMIGFVDDAQRDLFERWKRGDVIVGADSEEILPYKEMWDILSGSPDDEMGLLIVTTTEPYVTNQNKYSTEFARMLYQNYPFYVIYLQPTYIKFGKPSNMAITDDRGPTMLE